VVEVGPAWGFGRRPPAVFEGAVDDGTSVRAWSFRVERPLWERLRVGDRVQVVCGPRLRSLRALVPVTVTARAIAERSCTDE